MKPRIIFLAMNRCSSCKNTRRQLLMLKCSHDVCVKCAADNYFINCKNKIGGKRSRNNNYYCEKCLEQTELDARTAEELRKYFMDAVNVDDKQKMGRRERITERENYEKERQARLQRAQGILATRPKSLEIEIAERKRTLSKYLNEKQVDKFIEMQDEYGAPRKSTPTAPLSIDKSARIAEIQRTSYHNNEYELSKADYDGTKKKEPIIPQRERKIVNDSFQHFAKEEKVHNDYMRSGEQLPSKIRNHQKYNTTVGPQADYELYRNGRPITHLNPLIANPLLQEDRPTREPTGMSRYSSSSSAKAVGTIRSKRHRDKDTRNISPIVAKDQKRSPERGSKAQGEKSRAVRKQRLASCKSEENMDQLAASHLQKAVSMQNHQRIESSGDLWDIQSKSTKRFHQQKTIPHGEKNNSETMEKILETFEATNQPAPPPAPVINPKPSEKVEIYYCKIHQEEEIIYFCLRCNQLVCSQCALHGSHKAHEIHSLRKSGQLLRQRLAHDLNSLGKMLIEQQSKQKILKQCLSELSLQCGQQKEKIRSSFENFIFHADKKYKQLLREVEDRFATAITEYSEKLVESRNNYLTVSKMKDAVCQTLQECAGQEGTVTEASIGAACNQLGAFHVRRKQKGSVNIEQINRLTNRIRELQEFLKHSNILLFSNKKDSLVSEHSSLKLSQSSNLLQEEPPQTPSASSIPQKNEKSDKRSKKIVVSAYALNVRSRVKLSQCDSIVQSLVEMQDIIRTIKLECVQYELKALL